MKLRREACAGATVKADISGTRIFCPKQRSHDSGSASSSWNRKVLQPQMMMESAKSGRDPDSEVPMRVLSRSTSSGPVEKG